MTSLFSARGLEKRRQECDSTGVVAKKSQGPTAPFRLLGHLGPPFRCKRFGGLTFSLPSGVSDQARGATGSLHSLSSINHVGPNLVGADTYNERFVILQSCLFGLRVRYARNLYKKTCSVNVPPI